MKKLLYVALLAIGVVILMAPPAVAQEEKPFTIHGEVRFRGEYNNNAFDLDDNGATDDGHLVWPYRYRIAAEGRFTKNISAWIEIQNADVAGNNSGPSNGVFGGPFRTGQGGDGSDVELYQANITIGSLWSKNFSLRIGRQEIVAGNELLLGDLDFYTGISHDGLVGNWMIGKTNLMLWYTRPNEGGVASGAGNITPPLASSTTGAFPTAQFFGGYATWTIFKNQNLDAYAMVLNDRALNEDIDTVGARWAHDQTTKSGLIWNIEYAQQFGDFDSVANIKAKGHVLEAWAGWNFKAGKNVHRLYARIENASGDDTTSTDHEGFVPMFGDYHNRTGRGDWFILSDSSYAGVAGVGGLMAWAVGYTGYFGDRNEIGAQYWDYSMDDDTGFASSDLGNAWDIWYGYNYSRNLSFTASFSELSPGDALQNFAASAAKDSVDRIYGQARFRF